MKVSVIIPVYNVKLYLEHCVQSVLRQTYKDLELSFVDDFNADGSCEMCDNIATSIFSAQIRDTLGTAYNTLIRSRQSQKQRF